MSILTVLNSDFRPIEVGGLVLSLLPADGSTVTESSDLVTNLADKSGNGYDSTATGAGSPTANVTLVNGKGVIDFATDDFMTNDTGIIPTFAGSLTMFAVAKRTVDSSTQGIFATTSNKCILFYGNAGEILFRSNNSAANSVTNSGNTTTDFNIIRARRDGTTQAIAINGGTEASNTSGSNLTGVTATELGNTIGGSNFLTGSLAAFLLFNKNLTTEEIFKVETYLSKLFGIQIV